MPFNLDKEYLMKLYQTRLNRLNDYIKSNQMKASVIGVSGGIDSALALFMLRDTIGSDNVYPMMLPSNESSESSIKDAKEVIEAVGIPSVNVKLVEIGDIVELSLKKSGIDINQSRPMVKGNISARIRMVQLYTLANHLCYIGKRAFVEGTENESEYRTGYFTKYGDSGTDFEALKGLYKTQIRAISKLVGVPNSVITKIPSAELVTNQTDEGEMGISYEDLDKILFVLFEERNYMKLNEYPKERIETAIALIEKSSHKREEFEEKRLVEEAKKFINL
jgi:NAD+ synthase